MRTGHLFAGGGGGLYADLILGHTPIFAVEWDPYACGVLRSRASDGWFPGLRVHEGDVRLFDPSEYAGGVDCIHAGFPCQDISAAGKGAGITGERSGLYKEVIRAIGIIRPEWVMLENSPLIRTRGRHVVIADLRALGYTWSDGILSAADVGAPHKRDRWWCLARRTDPEGIGRTESAGEQGGSCATGMGDKGLAHPDRDGLQGSKHQEPREGAAGMRRRFAVAGRADVADSNMLRLQLGHEPGILGGSPGTSDCETRHKGSHGTTTPNSGTISLAGGEGLQERQGPAAEQWPHPAIAGGDWWNIEPDVGRLVNGMALRSHQIKCLGNGQVPLCAAAAWKILGGP